MKWPKLKICSTFLHMLKKLLRPSAPQILSGVILEVLSEDFPECFTAEVQLVWTKLMGALYWHVTGAYTEVGWLQVSSSAVWRIGKRKTAKRCYTKRSESMCVRENVFKELHRGQIHQINTFIRRSVGHQIQLDTTSVQILYVVFSCVLAEEAIVSTADNIALLLVNFVADRSEIFTSGGLFDERISRRLKQATLKALSSSSIIWHAKLNLCFTMSKYNS